MERAFEVGVCSNADHYVETKNWERVEIPSEKVMGEKGVVPFLLPVEYAHILMIPRNGEAKIGAEN